MTQLLHFEMDNLLLSRSVLLNVLDVNEVDLDLTFLDDDDDDVVVAVDFDE